MRPGLRQARLVWGALLASLVAYLAVLALLLRQPSDQPATDVATMRLAFAALAVASVAGILFFRRRLPSAERDPARTRSADADPTFTLLVIGWALAESVALYGLVLGMLSRRLDEALPFFAAGAVLLVWQRPRREDFAARP